MAISETKRSGVESYPYPVKDGQRYINLNPGRLLFSSHAKRERDREAHLNYYASSYNRGRQLSHCETRNLVMDEVRIRPCRWFGSMLSASSSAMTLLVGSQAVKTCARYPKGNLPQQVQEQNQGRQWITQVQAAVKMDIGR